MAGSPAALTLPLLRRKSVIAGFNGGDITSDAGPPLIAQADRKLRLLDWMSSGIRDWRDQSRVRHSLLGVVRSRTYAIAAVYEDGRQRLLAALLRTGKAEARKGLWGLLRRTVMMMRGRFPDVRILLRGNGPSDRRRMERFADDPSRSWQDAREGTGEIVPLIEQPKWANTWLTARFVRWLDGGEPMETNVAVNLQSVARVFAAIQSSRTGQPVRVQEMLERVEEAEACQ